MTQTFKTNHQDDQDEQTGATASSRVEQGDGALAGGDEKAGSPVNGTSILDLPTAAESRALRLVALDMDGTLARSDRTVSEAFWPVAEALLDRGVVLCAASGRQREAILQTMAPVADRITVMSENGAAVWRGEDVLRAEVVDREIVVQVVRAVRDLVDDRHHTGLVAGAPGQAFVESTDEVFLEHARRYNPNLEVVDDLTNLPRDIVKLAVWTDEPIVENVYPALSALPLEADVVRSGENWVDVMRTGTSKGASITRLRETLGIPREQCAAFGDHHNDLTMLEAVGMSFAVANAEPEVKDVARFVAPSNDDNGVLHVLRAMLAA